MVAQIALGIRLLCCQDIDTEFDTNANWSGGEAQRTLGAESNYSDRRKSMLSRPDNRLSGVVTRIEIDERLAKLKRDGRKIFR
jgi:hypothetical protein